MTSTECSGSSTRVQSRYQRDGQVFSYLRNLLKRENGVKPQCSNDTSDGRQENAQQSERVNIFTQAIKSFVTKFSSRDCEDIQSLILTSQCRGFSQLFFILFLFITMSKYTEQEIFCIRYYDRTVPDEHEMEVCLNYPYTEKTVNGQTTRHYILFYRWFHLGMCFFSGYFYLLVFLMQKFSFKPLTDIILMRKTGELTIKKLKMYWKMHLGAHGKIHRKKIYLHVLALIMNIFGVFLMDLLIQGSYRFLPLFLLIKRDMVFFDDDMSLTFPPFIKCEISTAHQLWLERKDLFGCHLPNMIIYEKIVFIIGACQCILAVWCFLYIMLLFFPYFLKYSKTYLIVQGWYQNSPLTRSLASKLSVGECYAFGLTTSHIGTKEFIEIQKYVLNLIDEMDM